MLDTVNSQYDSFLFWKLPIPELDLTELEVLGMDHMATLKARSSGKRSGGQKYADPERPADEDILSQYNSFNYWRAPIASIDFDFL